MLHGTSLEKPGLKDIRVLPSLNSTSTGLETDVEALSTPQAMIVAIKIPLYADGGRIVTLLP